MKHKYFKLNEDDILHIVKEYLLAQLELDTSQGRLEFVEAEGGTIQLIAAFSELEDDSFEDLELSDIANEITLNGPVSSLNKNFTMNLNSSDTKEKIQKLIEKIENEGVLELKSYDNKK